MYPYLTAHDQETVARAVVQAVHASSWLSV
jgi:hypothetical protein